MILILLVPFLLLIISIILFIKTSNLKKQLRQKRIEQVDKELYQLLEDKQRAYKEHIKDIEDTAEKKQQWLRKTIEENEFAIKKQEEYKQKILNKEYENVDKEVENYRIKRQNEITSELDNLKNIEYNYIEKKKLESENEIEQHRIKIKNEIDKTKSDFELDLERRKQEQEKFLEQRQSEINSEIVQMIMDRQEISEELEDFRNKHAAVNEAILREKELQERETFYKIDIPENDREDIQVLREIEPRLRNKEALNKLIYDVFIKRPSQEMIKRITQGRKISGIYKITYIKTGEAYVGRTSDIANRWKQHIMSSLNIGTIAHTTFHNFLANKGLHQFTFEILEEVEKEKLNEREKYWIAFYETDKQLNSNSGG